MTILFAFLTGIAAYIGFEQWSRARWGTAAIFFAATTILFILTTFLTLNT